MRQTGNVPVIQGGRELDAFDMAKFLNFSFLPFDVSFIFDFVIDDWQLLFGDGGKGEYFGKMKDGDFRSFEEVEEGETVLNGWAVL